MKNHLKKYFETLKESFYADKLLASFFFLTVSIIAIYTLNTPVEKVVATYIVLDIVAKFVMVGILTYHKTNYLDVENNKLSVLFHEGLNYLLFAGLVYSLMYFDSNYEQYSFLNFVINIVIVCVFGIAFIVKLESYRKIYSHLFKKTGINNEDFKSFYLFDSYDDLYFKFHALSNLGFALISLEKNGIKVDADYIYINKKPYNKKQYIKYMRETDIKTVDALTEEDRLLIEMINIK